jgi:EmrB/QacA subfamily drug resistance transporter
VVSVRSATRESVPGLAGDGRRLISRPALLLAVCCVAQFMVILDLSIVNVALPSIQVSLRFSAAELQWVVDAYAIVFAGFLMLAGRCADIFGQRRTFLVALTVFGLASLAGGAAATSEVLIVARGVQGLGAALMAASSLAVITSSFTSAPERHRAIAWWGAMNGAGGAAGTLLGGLITQEASWRWVLLINVPIAFAAALAARLAIPERRAETRPGFDLPGAIVLTTGLLVVAYGAVTAGDDGWGTRQALVPIAAGSALLLLFPLVERRVRSPLVPLAAITRRLRVVNGIVLLFSAALFPMWYLSSLYLQQVLGRSPLDTGLVFLPMALAIFACASQAGKLVGRFGVRAVLGGGLLLMTAGMAMLAGISDSGSAVQYVLLPGLLTALGIGFSIVPSTIAATQGAQPGQAGLASGLVNTSRQIGGGLGLAVLISIATQRTSSLIGESHTVAQALTEGFRLGYVLAACLAGTAAVLTYTLIPRPEPVQARGGRLLLAAAAGVIACFAAVEFGVPRTHAAPIGEYTTKGAYSFVSAPALHPPRLQLEIADARAANKGLAGDILLANFYDLSHPPIVGQSGPLIVDRKLQPVWFRPVPTNVVASNLAAQTYQGRPVLTWWQGVVTATGQISSGEDVVVDQHYQTVATLTGVDGWVLTLHSFVIDGDDAWVTANKNLRANLSRYGGVNDGTLDDSAVQEYDLRTGRLLYTWDALRHVPLASSYTQPPPNGFPWDAYHANSISLGPDGTFVVSLRNTWAAYLVDRRTGDVDWTLGGRHSSFALPQAAGFEWQHDVELHSGGVVTLFDDHCCEITGAGQFLAPTGPSRGLALKLDPATHTATVLAQYSHGATFDARYMGNVQRLPGGNVFVGWGEVPFFSELTGKGGLVLDGIMPTPDMSYRALVEPWVGEPSTPPRGAARGHGGGATVFASWNGATRVASWRVLAGPAAGSERAVATAARSGFETAIPVRGTYARFRVEALDAGGRVIGTSGTFGLLPAAPAS